MRDMASLAIWARKPAALMRCMEPPALPDVRIQALTEGRMSEGWREARLRLGCEILPEDSRLVLGVSRAASTSVTASAADATGLSFVGFSVILGCEDQG